MSSYLPFLLLKYIQDQNYILIKITDDGIFAPKISQYLYPFLFPHSMISIE